jgi:hypothetical protein
MALSRRRTEMARKRHTPDEIVAKLRQVDVLVSQGQAVAAAEAVRSIGVSEETVPACGRLLGRPEPLLGPWGNGLRLDRPRAYPRSYAQFWG